MMIDLQMFAEGEAVTTTPAEVTETAAETEVKPENTEVDVDAKIESALSKYAAKMEAAYKKQLEAATTAAKKEAQRLEKMSEDERQKAELENARKELETKERELKRKEIELEMVGVLTQRGIPVSFMNYFITDDNEETLERIKTFEKAYKAEIEKAVNEKLKGKAPAASSNKTFDVTKGGGDAGTLAALIKQNQAKKR